MADQINCDVLIAGAGPAGLSAAIYTARANKKTIVLSGKIPSRLISAHMIENYPGIDSLSGADLLSAMMQQTRKLGAEILEADAFDFGLNPGMNMVNTKAGLIIAKSVIIATGVGGKGASIKGDEQFLGRGVSYCATCDGPFFRNKPVIVYGQDHDVVEEALHLKQLGCTVTVMLKGSIGPGYESLFGQQIQVLASATITEISGEKTVSGVKYLLGKEQKYIDTSAVFISGNIPQTAFLKRAGLAFDEKGYIVVDSSQATSVAGVYAAGDVSSYNRQVVVAAGQGAAAAMNAIKFLNTK